MTNQEISDNVMLAANEAPTWMDEAALLRAHCRELAARLDEPGWRTDVENAPIPTHWMPIPTLTEATNER